ncbi:serine/threonine-protein kinase [Streptomyces sp. NPDC001595]|uniref:serine/threonine-protein kinase n=1 Tax=Streptomyces sp. NPDC001532 TaxID=3154520 RepID=UPI00332EA2D4
MRLRQSVLTPFRCVAQVLGGRYRLDEVIGSGGTGDVHRGFDLRLKRPVAVKVFRDGAGADAEDGFHNETMILARLRHPGLVTVYDAGRHEGRPYLVMELIDGPTLKARIAAGPLAPGEAAALGAGLARALTHAHGEGIVHRDVKPSNIILDASGRPHLTDFGISRALDSTTRTSTGTIVGTAAYLSPEQVLGGPVGPSADVYSLGLVLLECVTSRLEYEGAPLEAAIARLHRQPELPDSLPEEYASLLREMTALDAQVRPSAEDCARTLDALADTISPQPLPSTAGATGLVPRQASQRADLTDTHASPAAATAAPQAAPARGRHLVAGTAAALAAAVAATLAVAEYPSHGNGDEATRAVSSPSAETGTSGKSAPSGARLADPGRDEASGPATPSRQPATDTGTGAGTGTQATTPAPSHSTAPGTASSEVEGTSASALGGGNKRTDPSDKGSDKAPKANTEEVRLEKGRKKKAD